jgi:hypothetical protein
MGTRMEVDMAGNDTEREANRFVLDCLFFWNLVKKYTQGKILRLIADAHISFEEASILTGIRVDALRRCAKEACGMRSDECFSLLKLVEIAAYEVIVAMVLPWRDSYQHLVRQLINAARDEYRTQLNALFSHYFDMDIDAAKAYETQYFVVAGYFKMYPPSLSNEVPPSTNINVESQSTATANVINNLSIGFPPDLVKTIAEEIFATVKAKNGMGKTQEEDCPPSGQKEQSSEDAPAEKISVNVPPSLWAGKALETAAATLQDAGYDVGLIAYILVEKMKTPKLPTGRLLFPPSPGEGKEDSTYLRNIDSAIRRVTSAYSFTFSE